MDYREAGRQVIDEIFGVEYLQRRAGTRNSFNAVLQDYTDEVCFGRVWAREGLDRKTRSIINVAMLMALNRPAQLQTHIGGALTNGCSVEEIREVMLQAAVYTGLPSAIDAFRIAGEVFQQRGITLAPQAD